MARVKRDGTFYADDAKHTGNEPNWYDWEKLSTVEFDRKFRNGLNFYAYYCTFEDLKKDFLSFAELHYDKGDVRIVRKHYKRCKTLLTTAAKIARMYNQGMPIEHPKLMSHKNYFLYFKQAFNDAFSECKIYELWEKSNPADITNVDLKPKRKSPMELLKIKISENILTEVDATVDVWIGHEKADLNIMDLLGQNNIPANGCKFVREWLEMYLKDFALAQEAQDEDMVEAYSFLTKREINYICKSLNEAIADVNKFEATKKKTRAPRKTKVRTAASQVKDLKYVEEFSNEEYSVKGKSAVQIPNSVQVTVLNTKTNKLQVYFANGRSGFEVKGTTIKNFDEKKSYQFTVRKGKHKEVLESGDWEKYARNKKPVNGRMNEHCVILEVK